MKKHVLNLVSIAFIFLFTLSLFSCDTSGSNGAKITSGNSPGTVTKRDTTRPQEPLKVAVAATDSVTPDAQHSTSDSIGSKISIHCGKVKVVDTMKSDK